MSEKMKQLSYITKPYEKLGGFSIFTLNENGVDEYLKNKIVENQIIKKYGTMDIFQKSEIDNEIKNEKKTNIQNITKLDPINKGKTSSNWNQELKNYNKKFDDDFILINEDIENIKNSESINCRTQFNNFKSKNSMFDSIKNPNNMLKTTLDFRNNHKIENNSNLIDWNSRNKLLKKENRTKHYDAFCSNKVPRLNTGNDNLKIQFSFAKYVRDKYENDLNSRNTRSASTNIHPKVLRNWIDEENQKIRSFLPGNSSNEVLKDKYKFPSSFNKIVLPEVVYSNNTKGDSKMMGEKYNPYNYYIDSYRHTKKRNVYGSRYNN